MRLNLHALVSGAIGTINPFVPASIKQSTGYTVAPGGIQTPTYTETALMVQVQDLRTDELSQLDGLNLQSDTRAVYLSGNWDGIVRSGRKGGDLIIIGKQTYLVLAVLEGWPTWTKLACVLQNGG